MNRILIASILFLFIFTSADQPSKWQFAGESNGIRFYLKITNECQQSGANVAIKLENTLDHAVSVNFRLNDPEWSKTFEKNLAASGVDATLKYKPDGGTACHPYVDEVYVESKEIRISNVSGNE